MRISSQDSNSGQASLLSRLKELNLTPADALNDESSQLRLRTFSAEQLAELRQFRAQVLDDIGQVQNGSFFPGFPGLPDQPGGKVTPSPIQPGSPDYSCHDPREVLRKQDPEAYAALSGLPQEVQNEFLSLVRTMGFQPDPGKQLGGILGSLARNPGDEPRINPDLLALLKSGKLMTRDSTGRTLLQNLTSLSTQEMGPNLDRQKIFDELCKQINDPGQINQGVGKGTCAPTTIQHLQATRDPAEYARIMVGLTSESGEVRMRNGEILKRDLGSVASDGSGRDTISRLYQAALMEYANGENEYDNRTDEHTRPDDSTYSGLYAEESERALDALFGDQYDRTMVNNRTAEGRGQAEAAIRKALDAGQQVPVGISWGDGGHALLVIGMTESTVILRNPWGGNDRGGDGSNGAPPREALDDGGTIEMSKEEFFSRLNSMHLPKEGGGGIKFPGIRLPGFGNRGLGGGSPKGTEHG